jgi:TolB protein
MKRSNSIIIFLLICCSHIHAQSFNKIGMFEAHQDINNPKIKGDVIYSESDQTYHLKGAGLKMWAESDQLHFLYKKIKGDFNISASIEFIGKGVNSQGIVGIVARNSLDGGSPYADACVHSDGLTSLQFRTEQNGKTDQIALNSNAVHIELERKGNIFSIYAAANGENFKIASKEINLNEEVFAGLFICSNNPDRLEQVIFRNVRITIPESANYQPYRDYIGSHLEIMDVFNGHRKIVHSAPNSIQAPNWTADGKNLIYNSEGKLYYFDLEKSKISQMNTGFAIQNNNDHVISFDGKQMAISHHVGEKRTSTLFTLPITGSDNPTQITSPESGHSYLHSWSTDGKKLIFTGQRNNQYDIWTIDIVTKKETQLTNTPTLDDSPEMSPDGKWIYFNSVRTGTMQLWRMKPDGSSQEQITFDEYNDWFPHFSPDGKWIVYLSYPKEINPSDHPWYKKVQLKLMPSSGGVPKTIAYLYGGQGTINVPSWSPDSKRIAFVSNTKMD